MTGGTSPAKQQRSVGNTHLTTTATSHHSISAYESTSADDREAILRLIHHLTVLIKEVHTPYLDGLVMQKYVIAPLLLFAEEAADADDDAERDADASEGSPSHRGADGITTFHSQQDAASVRDGALANVVALVNVLTDHKQRTLEVLEAVSKRELAWANLQSALATNKGNDSDGDAAAASADKVSQHHDDVAVEPNPSASQQQDNAAQLQLPRPVYNPNGSSHNANNANHNSGATTLPQKRAGPTTVVSVEAAAMIQHHMYLLQKSSLHVVELVQQWRRGLSLPHPFMVGTENYLLKMLQQTSELAQNTAMMSVIPMQSLFYTYPLCSNIPSLGRYAEDPTKANFRASGAASTRGSHPYGPVCDSATTKRLQSAEKDLIDEVEQQVHVVQQLLELCQHGRFLPVINLRAVFPKAYVGAMSGNAAKHHYHPSGTSSSSKGLGLSSSAAAGGPASTSPALTTRGIPLRNPSLQRKLEVQLLHALDVLRVPVFRSAYDDEAKQNTKKAT